MVWSLVMMIPIPPNTIQYHSIPDAGIIHSSLVIILPHLKRTVTLPCFNVFSDSYSEKPIIYRLIVPWCYSSLPNTVKWSIPAYHAEFVRRPQDWCPSVSHSRPAAVTDLSSSDALHESHHRTTHHTTTTTTTTTPTTIKPAIPGQ